MHMLVALDIDAWVFSRTRAQYDAKVCYRFEGVDSIVGRCRSSVHRFGMPSHT